VPPPPEGSAAGDSSSFEISLVTTSIVFVAVLAVSLYPIVSHPIVSIDDFANHLGRIWVLRHYRQIPELHRYFVPYWQFQPDLAMDVVVGMLARFLPVYLAGKLFLALTFILVQTGVIRVHKAAFGTWSLWPFLAALLLYNRDLLSGLAGFLFGVGLYLNAVALWIDLGGRSEILRAIVLTVLAMLLYLAHLFAAGLLGLTLLGYQLSTCRRSGCGWWAAAGTLGSVLLPFVPALLLFVYLSPHADTAWVIEYRSLLTRIAAFGVPVLYDVWTDSLMGLAVAVLLSFLLATGALRLHRGLATAAALLLVAQLVMPNRILTATSVDHRIPIAMLLLLIAATDVVTPSRRPMFAFVIIILSFVPLRVWIIDQRWTRNDPVYAAILVGLDSLPPHAVVATVFPPSAAVRADAKAIAAYSLPAWRIPQRGGFTQTVFALPAQHPMKLTPEHAAWAKKYTADTLWEMFVTAPSTPQRADIDDGLKAALGHCDYLAFIDNESFAVPRTDLLAKVYDDPYIKIYRVRHDLL
jgi:hypothetical protein